MKSIMDLTARERRHWMLKLVWSATDMLDKKREMRNRAPLNRGVHARNLPALEQLDIDWDLGKHPLTFK